MKTADDRVVLEAYDERHAPGLYRAFAADATDIRKYVPMLEDVRSQSDLHECLRLREDEGNPIRTAAIVRDDVPVGALSYSYARGVPQSGVHVSGSWLGVAERGKGVMKTATCAFYDQAFSALRAPYVESNVARENAAACGLMKRLNVPVVFESPDGLSAYRMLARDWKPIPA